MGGELEGREREKGNWEREGERGSSKRGRELLQLIQICSQERIEYITQCYFAVRSDQGRRGSEPKNIHHGVIDYSRIDFSICLSVWRGPLHCPTLKPLNQNPSWFYVSISPLQCGVYYSTAISTQVPAVPTHCAHTG